MAGRTTASLPERLAAAGMLLAAVAATPPMLRLLGIAAGTRPVPHSGFWLAALFLAAGAAVIVKRPGAGRRRAIALWLGACVAIGAAEIGLRAWPPSGIADWWELHERPTTGAPPGEFHADVLVVGDSIAAGTGLREPASARFAARLQKGLSSEERGSVVATSAAPGSGLDAYLGDVEVGLVSRRPRVVVIALCMNDIVPDGGATDSAPGRLRAFADRWRLNESFVATLVQAGVWRAAQALGWTDRSHRSERVAYYQERLDAWWSDRQACARFGRDVGRVVDACRKGGARPVLLAFPYRTQTLRADDPISRALHDALRSIDAPLLDLLPTYRDEQRKRELYCPRDDCHPGPEGHALAARELLPVVRGLLSESAEVGGDPVRGDPVRGDPVRDGEE